MIETNRIYEDRLRAISKRRGTGRLVRLLQSPIRTMLPRFMRKMNLRKDIDIETIWDGKFSGVLPEAVTSVIWRFGYFETNVSTTLLRVLQPGSGFIDVGSHFGYFTLFASKLVGANGQVLAVEAMPSTFEQLEKNVRRNAPYPNIRMHPGAAFNKETSLEFSDFGLIASSLNSAFGSRDTQSLTRSDSNKVLVQAKPLDAILADKPMKRVDLVKIDAESSEKFVLLGMQETIKIHRPVIAMEVGDVAGAQDAGSSEQIAMIENLNYKSFRWTKNFELENFVIDGPVPYENLVFIPVEKVETLVKL